MYQLWKQFVAVTTLAIGLSLTTCGTIQAQQQPTQTQAAQIPDHGIVHQLMQAPADPPVPQSRIVIRDPQTKRSAAETTASPTPVLVNAMRAPLRSQPVPERSRQVQQVSYDPEHEEQPAWSPATAVQPITVLDPADANDNSQSFIEREKTQPEQPRESAREMIAKISINLALVLAIATAAILTVRYWQKSKLEQPASAAAKVDSLIVSQVLPLTNGASLHVVEGTQNKFVVAIDAGGIKSVNVLTQSFEDTLQESGAFDPTTGSALEPISQDEASTEIDEKLIKLLLKSTTQAA